MESLSEKLFDFLARLPAGMAKIPKSFYVPILLSLSGLLFLIVGLIQLLGSRTQPQGVPVSSPEVQVAATSSGTFGMHVDVEGAVMRPGVYVLQSNARVQDAIVAAGGLSGTADRQIIAQRVNLAAKLSDGMKIYLPDTSGPAQQAGGSAAPDFLGAQVHLIDINQASAEELDSLPGIGPVTASKIIGGRPYSAVADLVSKKIISQSVYDKIKDSVSVY